MKTLSMAASVAVSLSAILPSVAGAYCLDGVAVGMFTEREFTELEAPPRAKAQDKRLNALLKRGMRASGANLITVDGETKKQALKAAALQKLQALAFLELEAVSRKSALPGPILDISSTTSLQILAVPDGRILGEGSDISEVPGVDIEDALPDILTVKTVETLAGQAEKAACKKGLSPAEPLVAEAPAAPASPKPRAADPGQVAAIQHALIAAGFDPGLPDGMMGRQTAEAIKLAEMALKMPSTGKPSALLLQRLSSLDRAMIGEVQQALFDLGRLDSRPSRVLDSNTRRAIEEAEFDFGLSPADGLPDADLLRVLHANLPEGEGTATDVDAAAPAPANLMDDSGLRMRIEELLVQLNYFAGPATGIPNIDSEQAIWKAERDFGLEADGKPDKQLWRLLDAKVNG